MLRSQVPVVRLIDAVDGVTVLTEHVEDDAEGGDAVTSCRTENRPGPRLTGIIVGMTRRDAIGVPSWRRG